MSNLEKMNEVSVVKETNFVPVIAESNPVQVLSMISNLVKKESFDIHALEKLIMLQNDAEDRQAKKSFNRDLSEMLSEIPVIVKSGVNEFQKTKFARLEDIVEKTRPILHKHGFSITYKQSQDMLSNDTSGIFCMMTVTCILKHRDGHEESNEMILPIATIKGQTPIQAMGMGSTYGRRYTLMQALNIAVSGDDSDGFAVNVKEESRKKPVSDNQLDAAIEQINTGKRVLSEFINKYDLSPEQLVRLGREAEGE